jgi:hypothetical protein
MIQAALDRATTIPGDLGWPRSTAAPLASETSRFCPACYRRRGGESGPLVWVRDRPRHCRASGVGKDVARRPAATFEETAYFFCSLACAAEFARHHERFARERG